MASDIILGRKAASNGDVGVGETAQNETRLTLLAQPSADYWVTHLGAHVGWDGGGTPPTCTIAAYWTKDLLPTTLAAKTASFETRAYYPATGAYSGGEDRELRLAAPIILRKNWALLAGVHARSRWMTHGMNNDGSQMSRDYDNLAPPTTFRIDRRDAQGRMTVWARARKNSPPAAPSKVSPANGGQTTDQRPTIAGDFRDPDETLTGFAIGQADKMSAYQVIVYNAARTAVVWDSGVVTASATERANRRFAIRPVSNLASNLRYTVQARVRDDVGAWSTATSWSFTVLAGGATMPTGPTGRVTTQSPTMSFDYAHRDGTPLASVDVEIRTGAGAVANGPTNIPYALASGGSGLIAYPAAWTMLPRGADYTVRTRPVDANGVVGAWTTGPAFRVNALPPAPANMVPASGEARSRIGVFRLTASTDADGDPPSGYVAEAWVRKTSAPDVLHTFPMTFQGMSGSLAVFEGAPSPDFMNTWEAYEWSAQMHDQFGEAGAWSGYTSFTYAQPPAISITAPATSTIAGQADVTVATPTVTFTSDPAAAKQRVRWVDAETRITVHDSGLVTATGSDRVASGEIRTGRSYDLVVGVQTGLGIYGEVVKRVSVAFPPPATLTDQVMTLVEGKFDSAGMPTVFQLAWTDPSTDESTFQGYGIYLQEGTGTPQLVAVERNMTTRTFVPEFARLDTTVRMWATRFERKGDDLLEGEPPTVIPAASLPYFGGTIISDLDSPGENRVVAAWWLSRKETPVRAREQRDGWGRYPTVSVGERRYERIEGEWDVINEPNFSSVELKNAMVALSDPVSEQRLIHGRLQHVLRPRKLCYRDATGRRIFGTLEIEDAEDTHRAERDVRWRFTETGPMPQAKRPTLGDPEMDDMLQALQGLLTGGEGV